MTLLLLLLLGVHEFFCSEVILLFKLESSHPLAMVLDNEDVLLIDVLLTEAYWYDYLIANGTGDCLSCEVAYFWAVYPPL